ARRKPDAPADIAQPVEEVDVLAAAAPEFGAEAQLLALDQRTPNENVSGVAGLDAPADIDRPRRMKIAILHPAGDGVRIHGLHRTKDGIPLPFLGFADQGVQPLRCRAL